MPATSDTLNVTATLAIVPVDTHIRQSARLPGLPSGPSRYPRNRRRLEPGRQGERQDLHQPQDRSAGIRQTWLRCRLVKVEEEDAAGNTHIALWEPRD